MTERKERSYWTVGELADRWQVTERAVRKWIVEGAFPGAYKVGLGKGSHYRIPPEDVVSFEQRRKINR